MCHMDHKKDLFLFLLILSYCFPEPYLIPSARFVSISHHKFDLFHVTEISLPRKTPVKYFPRSMRHFTQWKHRVFSVHWEYDHLLSFGGNAEDFLGLHYIILFLTTHWTHLSELTEKLKKLRFGGLLDVLSQLTSQQELKKTPHFWLHWIIHFKYGLDDTERNNHWSRMRQRRNRSTSLCEVPRTEVLITLTHIVSLILITN